MEIFTESQTIQGIELGRNVDIKTSSNNNPLTIKLKEDIDVFIWAKQYKDELNKMLLDHGALLLRGFKIDGAKNFNKLFSIISGKGIEYKNRTSPRDRVYNNVYTSTSHPSDQTIHMHTENSYSNLYNRIIAFYSLVPALKGGETPIADERKLLAC